uniref:ITPR-interacting domain-containing protein n=1 Tax=Knipowitschia caucasica TaxID=637954 RepID=A0AAV2JKL3_KNICA
MNSSPLHESDQCHMMRGVSWPHLSSACSTSAEHANVAQTEPQHAEMELLWNDDPEELLLELGFGCDEPDLSGLIPARFINYQSQARGINLQVYLEAMKSRIDLENPDVSNRFRQLEVLQQVSVAFSSLAGNQKGLYTKDMSLEARERRKRMGMLLRRASKKSLSQLHRQANQEVSSAIVPKAPESMYGAEERKVAYRRVKRKDTVGISPFVEEEAGVQTPTPEAEAMTGSVRERNMDKALLRKKNLQMRESFEMEELGSFEDSSTIGQDLAGTHFARGLIRVNSCQSDSSGFLEDFLIPALPQDPSPASDLLKALSALSGGSTDSHSGVTTLQNTLCTSTTSDHAPEHHPQLSSSSSHIVQRKDVPYADNPKHVTLPRRFKLDTSDPFRAVQSWTNLHIQHNPKGTKSSNVPAHEWQSDDCLHRISREHESRPVSMDTGLWTKVQDEEVDRSGGHQSGPLCDHTCCKQSGQHHMRGQGELDTLLYHLQRFCCVLGLMEEHVTEEQAGVYSALSPHDRVCVEELLQLRQAVRQEAVELDKHLSDLGPHHDFRLIPKIVQLLEEQSLLCSQLHLFSLEALSPVSGALIPVPGPTHKRTVATQCSLQKGPHEAPGPPQVQAALSQQALGCAPAKDKRHLVGLLHRLRHSIRH